VGLLVLVTAAAAAPAAVHSIKPDFFLSIVSVIILALGNIIPLLSETVEALKVLDKIEVRHLLALCFSTYVSCHVSPLPPTKSEKPIHEYWVFIP